MAARVHNVGVIIAAGGSGRRMGGRLPKQFLPLGGKPIIARTIAAFEAIQSVGEIVVVAPREHIARTQRLCRTERFRKVSCVCHGGKVRQDSVRRGLGAFARQPAIVLVHDAVRPLVSNRVIRRVIQEATRHRAAVVGVRVKDTIKVEGRKGFYKATLDRSKLWAVQTPQGFRYKLLRDAHVQARISNYLSTDEASLVERLGVPVRIVEGDYTNFKITTLEDLKAARIHLR